MELVEGETLAERLAAGPIPPREALSVALQIAEALEHAHARAIVHRDLKPAGTPGSWPAGQTPGRQRQGDLIFRSAFSQAASNCLSAAAASSCFCWSWTALWSP
jgi:serine/threonine protein kinase